MYVPSTRLFSRQLCPPPRFHEGCSSRVTSLRLPSYTYLHSSRYINDSWWFKMSPLVGFWKAPTELCWKGNHQGGGHHGACDCFMTKVFQISSYKSQDFQKILWKSQLQWLFGDLASFWNSCCSTSPFHVLHFPLISVLFLPLLLQANDAASG